MEMQRYDSMLREILEERKTIAGFLDAMFGFLSRNTDFYYEQKNKDEKIGFPPGMKEKIVLQVLQKFDPKYRFVADSSDVPPAITEVEVGTANNTLPAEVSKDKVDDKPKETPKAYFAPSEYRNGAKFDKYCWSQTSTEVELHVILPPDIKYGKQLNTVIHPHLINVQSKIDQKAPSIFNGKLHARCKHLDALWTISEGKLQIILDKKKEGWWERFIESEPKIDVSKIDCSKDVNELPPDTQAAIEKLRWEQQMKEAHKPTELEEKNLKLLREAWDAEGSPFKGQPFDPSLVKFN